MVRRPPAASRPGIPSLRWTKTSRPSSVRWFAVGWTGTRRGRWAGRRCWRCGAGRPTTASCGAQRWPSSPPGSQVRCARGKLPGHVAPARLHRDQAPLRENQRRELPPVDAAGVESGGHRLLLQPPDGVVAEDDALRALPDRRPGMALDLLRGGAVLADAAQGEEVLALLLLDRDAGHHAAVDHHRVRLAGL